MLLESSNRRRSKPKRRRILLTVLIAVALVDVLTIGLLAFSSGTSSANLPFYDESGKVCLAKAFSCIGQKYGDLKAELLDGGFDLTGENLKVVRFSTSVNGNRYDLLFELSDPGQMAVDNTNSIVLSVTMPVGSFTSEEFYRNQKGLRISEGVVFRGDSIQSATVWSLCRFSNKTAVITSSHSSLAVNNCNVTIYGEAGIRILLEQLTLATGTNDILPESKDIATSYQAVVNCWETNWGIGMTKETFRP